MFLNMLFYLTLTLMLGTLSEGRGGGHRHPDRDRLRLPDLPGSGAVAGPHHAVGADDAARPASRFVTGDGPRDRPTAAVGDAHDRNGDLVCGLHGGGHLAV